MGLLVDNQITHSRAVVVLVLVLAAVVDSCYTGDIGEPFLVVGVEVVVAVAVVVLALVVVDNT